MIVTEWCSICQSAPAEGTLLAQDPDGMEIPFPACTDCVENRIRPDGTFDIEYNLGSQ